MNKKIILSLFLGIFFINGCYHAQITTDMEPSNRVVDKPWSHGFLFGLVPPAVLDASDECTSGVAKVETRLSFLNQVASILTGGVYTPMHIKVTCAASGALLPDEPNSPLVVQPTVEAKE